MYSLHVKPDQTRQLYMLLVQPAARVLHGIRAAYDTSAQNLFSAELEAEWKRRALRRNAAAALAVAFALLISIWLRPVFHRNPFLFYYAAVMFSAWYGGLYSGLLATLTAATAAGWLLFFKFPTLTPMPDDFAQIGLFLAVGAVTSILIEFLRKTERFSLSMFRAQEFLAEAGRVLSSSFDYETRLVTIAARCVPALADCCAIDIVQEDGSLRHIAHAATDDANFSRSGNAHADLEGPASEVIRSRQGRLLEWTADPRLAQDSRDMPLSSGLVVPMISGDKVLGSITLASCSSGRRYRAADLAFMERLALRAAIALDNANLYRESQQELRERERAEAELRLREERLRNALRQQAVVAKLGQRALAVSAGTVSLSEFMDEFVREVAVALKVEYCKILELLPDGKRFLLRAGVGWAPGQVGTAMVDAGCGSQAGYTLLQATPVIVRDVQAETRFSAPPLLAKHGIDSGISVVIPGPRGPYGVLGAHSHEPHAFSHDDVHFIESGATLLAAAIQRRHHLQQLQESEARFRTLAEAMPQMVWSTRPDGYVDYLSESWRTFTGQNPEQSHGYNGWKDVLHPDDRQNVLQRWTHSIESGEIYEVECRLRRADGLYRWILTRGVPLRDSEGGITKWIGTCTDVHDRKVSEEALRTAEKLAATGRLVSTMAHEINNPLEAVTNLLHIVRGEPAVANGAPAQYLAMADRELARVVHVVNQTMGLFQGSTRATRVNVTEVADEVLELYAGKIAAREIRVVRQDEAAGELFAVKGELRQMFAALITNALDASPRGGSLRVRISRARNWSSPETAGLRIVIADDGSGIRTEHRPRIFAPFFSTKGGIGTGLGLWSVREIVRKRAGTIRYRTSTRSGASGTVFSIFLPDEAGEETLHSNVQVAS